MAEVTGVPLSDSGFRYGLGIFETLVVRKGIALFQQFHLENLLVGAQQLGLKISTTDEINRVPEGDGVWRWFLTSSGLNTMFEAGIEHVPANYTLDLSPLVLSSNSWTSRYKTLSYLLHYQARHQTRYDETILLNEKGEIATASMANIFWIKKQTLYTPDENAGCRSGVVRRWVMDVWPREILMGRWPVEELDDADEIFVTNSRIGVIPVILWRKRDLQIGDYTNELRELYRGAVERQLAPHAEKREQDESAQKSPGD